MKKVNVDIRNFAKEKGVRIWQIADELGVAESTFIRSMRYELTPERKASVINAIEWAAAKNAE